MLPLPRAEVGAARAKAQVKGQEAASRQPNAPTWLVTPKWAYTMFWLHPAKLETKLVCFSGLAGRGVSRDGLPALPLRVLLENAKNGSAAMVAHAGCRVCQNGTRRWQNGRRCGPDAPRELHCPGRGGALAVGNDLFAVASTKNATRRTWHAHGTREGPWFLSRMRRDHYINLHG